MSEEVKNPEAVLAELRRAQEDLKALRAEVKELETAKNAAITELEQLKENATGDVFKTRALNAETKMRLQAEGFKDADRLLKYVDTSTLDFDDEGNVSGLEERLLELRTDLPELFDPKVRVGGKADIHANGEPVKPNPLKQAVHAALNN